MISDSLRISVPGIWRSFLIDDPNHWRMKTMLIRGDEQTLFKQNNRKIFLRRASYSPELMRRMSSINFSRQSMMFYGACTDILKYGRRTAIHQSIDIVIG